MKTTQMNVLISAIVTGKLNPRKTFNTETLHELSESIKSKGVLQPILVRPIPNNKGNDKAYEVVCGHRRLMASREAGLTVIPAVISEMTDEQALEAMIIENLQREGVHPMEEAIAINELLKKGKTIKEVSDIIGKGTAYIAKHAKLSNLIPKIQSAFKNGKMELSSALRLCVFDKKIQEQHLEDENYEEGDEIKVSDADLRALRMQLDTAPFDITDATIIKKMGACTLCTFNTNNCNSLFPELEGKAMCLNADCFYEKKDLAYQADLKKAIENPELILIENTYEKTSDGEALKKQGHEVLVRGYNGSKESPFEVLEKPVKMTKEEWEEENEWDIENEWSEKEAEKEWKQYCENFETETERYEKDIASPAVNKAFVVSGEEKGKQVYIKLKNKSAGKTKEGDTALKVDTQAEIKRIMDAEKRKKEIDDEKAQVAYQEVLEKDRKEYCSNTSSLAKDEIIAFLICVASTVGYPLRDLLEKKTKLSVHDGNKMFVRLSEMSDKERLEVMYTTARHLIADKVRTGKGVRPDRNPFASSLNNILNRTHPKEVADIQQIVAEDRAKREARIKERVDKLKSVAKTEKVKTEKKESKKPKKK